MNKTSTWVKLGLIVALGFLILVGPIWSGLYERFPGLPSFLAIAAFQAFGLGVLKPLVNYVVKSD